MVILNQIRNAAKRIPSIKFRAGKISQHENISSASVAQVEVSAKPSNAKVRGQSIEDWELPARYRRRIIDDKEINAINSGGAYN